jgi:polar amino acid transport system substrate-binding protein
MANIIKNIIWLSFICDFIISSAFATEAKLTVSVPSFPPFYFHDAENKKQCQGIAINILQRLSHKLTREIDIVPYPYARILHNLTLAKVDMALLFKNESISSSVDYIGPVSKSKVVIITSADKPIAQYSDLSKLASIAVIRNASFEPKFDQDKALNKFSVNSYTQALTMFNLGRVDGIVGSIVGLEYASTQVHIKIAKLSVFQLGEKEWWLHFAKKSPFQWLKPQLKSAVKKLYQDDLIEKTYQKYIAQCWPDAVKN